MSNVHNSSPLLLNDKEVARLLSMSSSWVRNQRFKQSRGEEHVFDVTPCHIGKSVRYPYGAVHKWCERFVIGDGSNENEPVSKSEIESPPWQELEPDTDAIAEVPRAHMASSLRQKAISNPCIGCRYIEGDPKIDPTNCGKTCKADSSYCEEHHARCYTKALTHKRIERDKYAQRISREKKDA